MRPDEDTQTAADRGPAEPWLSCAAPLVIYLLAGILEPSASGSWLAGRLGVGAAAYPVAYALRIAATVAVVTRIWPSLRAWVGRPCWWPPLLGVALAVPWVVLSRLQREAGWTFGVARAGYDPFTPEHLGPDSAAAWAFLAVRGLGLVVIVPLVEELFVRGFLMRYVIKERFWEVPFGLVTAASATACIAYAVASHPAEAVAAAGWFAMLTGVAAATRRPIDCILCHAATNLALGAYVLTTGEWWLV